MMLKGAMAAPSAGNQQPWEFYVVKNKETIEKLSKTSPYASCCASAPLAFVACYRTNCRMPEYAHIDDSGMDLYALEDYTIHPGETKLIPTGLKFAIPNGYELQIRPKSGRCLKTKLRVANTPATIKVA